MELRCTARLLEERYESVVTIQRILTKGADFNFTMAEISIKNGVAVGWLCCNFTCCSNFMFAMISLKRNRLKRNSSGCVRMSRRD